MFRIREPEQDGSLYDCLLDSMAGCNLLMIRQSLSLVSQSVSPIDRHAE